jgi:hypothetical protein
VVEVRRVALDAYLQELLANVNLRHDDHLREFLEEEEALQFERHEVEDSIHKDRQAIEAQLAEVRICLLNRAVLMRIADHACRQLASSAAEQGG